MSNKRKTLLINRPFQLSIIGQFGVLALAIALIYFVAMQLFFSKMVAQAQLANLPSGHVFYQFIQQQQVLMTRIYAVSSVVALLVTVVGGLWLSHRVAGPIHRLVQYLKSESPSPKASELHFRKNDYFPEVEEAMNEFIKK